jgi:hypothetical protein
MEEAETAKKREEETQSNEMPLEFMLKNMRDSGNDLQFRATSRQLPSPTISTLETTLRTSHTPPLSRSDLVVCWACSELGGESPLPNLMKVKG